jgi:hypothetical protein
MEPGAQAEPWLCAKRAIPLMFLVRKGDFCVLQHPAIPRPCHARACWKSPREGGLQDGR